MPLVESSRLIFPLCLSQEGRHAHSRQTLASYVGHASAFSTYLFQMPPYHLSITCNFFDGYQLNHSHSLRYDDMHVLAPLDVAIASRDSTRTSCVMSSFRSERRCFTNGCKFLVVVNYIQTCQFQPEVTHFSRLIS